MLPDVSEANKHKDEESAQLMTLLQDLKSMFFINFFVCYRLRGLSINLCAVNLIMLHYCFVLRICMNHEPEVWTIVNMAGQIS